jgi:hypothetical protein
MAGGDAALRGFELVAGFLRTVLEEGLVVARRVDAQLQRGVDVGLHEGVGQRGREARVGGAVGDDDHAALARGLDFHAALEHRAKPAFDGAAATGIVLPLLAHLRVLVELEVTNHALGHAVALDDVHLRGHLRR